MGDRGATLEERLARRFAAELTAAEADLPHLALLDRDGQAHDRTVESARLPRVRFALPFAAVALLIVAVLAALLGPWRGGVLPGASPSPTSTHRSDGIPTEIDGEHVYPVGDPAVESGRSVLVAGSVYQPLIAPSCFMPGWPTPSPGSTPPEERLLPAFCRPGSELSLIGPGGELTVGLLGQWRDLRAPEDVIVRAHAHDLLAAGCAVANRSQCERALVVESIVWQRTPPGEIDGRTVMTSLDSLPQSGPFALAGIVMDLDPSVCVGATPGGADAKLVACGGQSLAVGRAMANIARIGAVPKAALRQTIVMLAHTHDPLAASCTPEYRADCESAVVVDAILWPSSLATVQVPEPSSSPAVVLGPDGSRGRTRAVR